MGTRIGRRVGAKAASKDQRDTLHRLHMEVYGYVTESTQAEIDGMSWVRAAQETAQLMRTRAEKMILEADRAELAELYVELFGKDNEKLTEIAAYSAHRVYSDLRTLRRMADTRQKQRIQRIRDLGLSMLTMGSVSLICVAVPVIMKMGV